MLGVEMIGVLPIGVDIGTPNKYEESFLGSSEIAVIDAKQIILTSTDFPELIINDSATHNTVKTNVATTFLDLSTTDSYYRVFGYTNEDAGIEIAATDFHNLLLYVLDPAQIAVFSDVSGGASQSLQQFSLGGELVLNTQNAESFYTLYIQEFDNNPVRLSLGGTTGEMLVIAGGGGSTEKPQIWIG